MTALRNAADVAATGTPSVDEPDICSLLTTPGFEPTTDALLIFAPSGNLVGFLSIWADPPFTRIELSNFVHPDWIGHGIGTMLLDWSETRAAQIAGQAATGERVSVFQGVWLGARAAERFFEEHGYSPIRHYNTMEIQMGEPPPEPSWPPGIQVRTMSPGVDDRALYEAESKTFEDEWAFTHPSFEAWQHEVTGSDKFDRLLSFVAVDGDQIAGFAFCTVGEADNPEGGCVRVLGVRQPWRRRGIALGLLHHSFGELFRRGRLRVTLGVDAANPTGAVQVYERAGMHSTLEGTVFEKELVPGNKASGEEAK